MGWKTVSKAKRSPKKLAEQELARFNEGRQLEDLFQTLIQLYTKLFDHSEELNPNQAGRRGNTSNLIVYAIFGV